MRILVTGGAGFLGSNYIDLLLRTTNADVVTFDAFTYAGSRNNLERAIDRSRHRLIQGDIRDENLVRRAVADADVIAHFAAETHVDRSIADASDFVSTNVSGTRTILDAALQSDVDRVIHMSTDEV